MQTPEQQDKERERQRIWRANNRDRINQHIKEWRLANLDRLRAYQAKYRATHREEIRGYQQAYTKRYPDRFKTKMEGRLSKQRGYLMLLLSRGCLECGMSDVRVLQFDHVPERGTKKFKVTADVYKPWKTFLEEVEKCDVVCANCHAIRTYGRLLLDGRMPFREAMRTGGWKPDSKDYADR